MMHSLISKNRLTVILFVAGTCCLLSFNSCNLRTKAVKAKRITADEQLIDSLRRNSDSTYSKPYFTRDFASALYFVNKTDSTVAQVMKDKDSVIRQVLITRGKRKVYAAQYFPNGQLMENVKLDGYGQADGLALEYYENGTVKRSGNYRSGLHLGVWKNFDSTGNLISTDEYNKDGQVTKHKDE